MRLILSLVYVTDNETPRCLQIVAIILQPVAQVKFSSLPLFGDDNDGDVLAVRRFAQMATRQRRAFEYRARRKAVLAAHFSPMIHINGTRLDKVINTKFDIMSPAPWCPLKGKRKREKLSDFENFLCRYIWDTTYTLESARNFNFGETFAEAKWRSNLYSRSHLRRDALLQIKSGRTGCSKFSLKNFFVNI